MTNYNIEIREFNGVDYDVLYPVTTIQNVTGLQTELNKKASRKAFTTTLEPSNWTGDGSTTPFTQQINVSDITSTNDVFINIIPSSIYATAVNQYNQFQYISYVTALNGAIKFTCLSVKPTIQLSVRVLCFS